MTRREVAVWLLSAIGGAAIAFLILSYGIRALLALVALCVVAARVAPGLIGVGGALVGCGAIAFVAIASANARCTSAGEGRAACLVSSGGELALVVALAVFAIGAALTLRRMRPALPR